MIVDADDGELLGAVGLHDLDPASGRCSAGYWVAAAARGRGVATRACALLCALRASTSSACSGSSSGSSPRTPPRCAVAEAVGFAREGLLRSFMPIAGERRDMLMYSLLPDDLR